MQLVTMVFMNHMSDGALMDFLGSDKLDFPGSDKLDFPGSDKLVNSGVLIMSEW